MIFHFKLQKINLFCIFLSFHFSVYCVNNTHINTLTQEEQTLTTLSRLIFQNVPEYTNQDFFSVALKQAVQIFSSSDIQEIIRTYLETTQDFFNDEEQGLDSQSSSSSSSSAEEPQIPIFVEKQKISPYSKVCVIGDIHGSVHSLLRNLWRLKALKYIDKNLKITDKDTYFVFTGDNGDRGLCGIEVFYILILFKLRNWNNVLIVRGNHENIHVNQDYEFCKEIFTKYDKDEATKIISFITQLYEHLPAAVFFLCGHDIIQCCHGGIDFRYNPQNFDYHYEAVEDDFELTNADFYQPNNYEVKPKKRHNGVMINIIEAIQYMNTYNIKALFRGHQDLGFGCKMFFQNPEKLDLYLWHQTDFIYPCGPYHWQSVVGKKTATKSSGLNVSKNIPIFTFSSATEFRRRDAFDCFGILTTNPSYEKWQLQVYEYAVGSERNQEYISKISSAKPTNNPAIDPINYEYSHNPQQLRIQGFF